MKFADLLSGRVLNTVESIICGEYPPHLIEIVDVALQDYTMDLVYNDNFNPTYYVFKY